MQVLTQARALWVGTAQRVRTRQRHDFLHALYASSAAAALPKRVLLLSSSVLLPSARHHTAHLVVEALPVEHLAQVLGGRDGAVGPRRRTSCRV